MPDILDALTALKMVKSNLIKAVWVQSFQQNLLNINQSTKNIYRSYLNFSMNIF
jgi:hypothetical protein